MSLHRNHRRYTAVFLDANSPGPWVCHFCGEPVTKLLVHHLNHIETDDRAENLVAAHSSCHTRYHKTFTDNSHSETTKQRLRELQTGTVPSALQRAVTSQTHKGVPKSPEHRAKISAALQKSWNRRRGVTDVPTPSE